MVWGTPQATPPGAGSSDEYGALASATALTISEAPVMVKTNKMRLCLQICLKTRFRTCALPSRTERQAIEVLCAYPIFGTPCSPQSEYTVLTPI